MGSIFSTAWRRRAFLCGGGGGAYMLDSGHKLDEKTAPNTINGQAGLCCNSARNLYVL